MERPATIKDKSALAYIQFLESKLETYTKSPYVNSYLGIKRMIDRGNMQLEQAASADIDFESKEFTAIAKFLKLQKEYYEQMDYYRQKMTPIEQRELDELMKSGAGVAEKIALKNKNGSR